MCHSRTPATAKWSDGTGPMGLQSPKHRNPQRWAPRQRVRTAPQASLAPWPIGSYECFWFKRQLQDVDHRRAGRVTLVPARSGHSKWAWNNTLGEQGEQRSSPTRSRLALDQSTRRSGRVTLEPDTIQPLEMDPDQLTRRAGE